MPDVTCVGILVADLVGKPIDRYPERGKLTLVDRMELHGGGCAYNVAIALSTLGTSTAIVGKVGQDGLGDFLSNQLQARSVDTGGLTRDPRLNTSSSMVIVHSDGERSFLHCIGANAAFRKEDIDLSLIDRSKILMVAGALVMPAMDGEPTAELFRYARQKGITTAYDTVYNNDSDWMKTLEPALPHVDYFLPSFEEARAITGYDEPSAIAGELLKAGVKVAVLKMGEYGCYVRSEQEEFQIPVFPVDAIDGTGTGDAFVAGFLAALNRGWDLKRAARFANMVGACCVTALGASAGLMSLEETLARFDCPPEDA